MAKQEEERPNLLDLVDELEPLEPVRRIERMDQLGLSPEVRARVERCLRHGGAADDFLQRPPAPEPAWASSSFTTDETSANGSGATAASREELWTKIPGYEIKAKLGEGGMGSVWRAVQVAARREVAVKVMGAAWVGSERTKARFDREVQITAGLEHPHIARVYDSGVHQGTYFYAMELIDGLPLDAFVEQTRLPRRRVLALMRTVCQAVAHAHQNGVIHRDLKPSNILVTKDCQPHVLDFGLAKAVEEAGSDLTMEGDLSGTPAYMSPEQAAGNGGRLDTRSDVYSLGVILYRLLTGRSPHDLSGTRSDLLKRIGERDVRAPREAKLDRDLEAVLLKALARDRERRYASATELARDLDHYLTGEPVSAKPPTLGYLAQKRLRRHWLPASAAAAALMTLLATAGFFYGREFRLRKVAETNERRAELNLAQSKLAEADALVASNEIGRAGSRFEEAREILERNGASAFDAVLGEWDVYRRSPPPLTELSGHTGQVNCFAYLPGGREIISGSEDGTGRLWDAVTGRTIRVFEGVGRVQRLSLSADGKTVAFAAMGHGVTLWSLEAGVRVGDLRGFTGEAASVAFSPDGTHLFVGTTDKKKNAYLFDVRTGNLVRAFDGHTATVRAAAFSPDGKLLVTGSGRRPGDNDEWPVDGTVRAWDVASGRLLWQQLGSSDYRLIADVTVSSDGSVVLSGSYGQQAETWDLRTGRAIGSSRRGSQVNAVAFSRDGLLMATGANAGVVEVSWAPSGEPLEGANPRTLFFARLSGASEPDPVKAVSFSSDGRFVAAAAGNAVRIWPLVDHTAHRQMNVDAPHWFGDRNREYSAATLSPDGQFALTSDTISKTVEFWEVDSGQLLARVNGSRRLKGKHDFDSHAVLGTFVPGPTQRVLLTEESGKVALRDGFTHESRVRYLERREDQRAAGVCVSPDGRQALVRFQGEEELQLYDLASGRRTRGLKYSDGVKVHRMAFSPNCELVAACDQDTGVTVWEVASGKQRPGWTTTGRAIRIAFSPDGRLLACVGAALDVFEVATGSRVLSKRWPSNLGAVAFLPDGQHLAVGGEGADWYFVDVANGATRTISVRGGSFVWDWAVSGTMTGSGVPLRLLAAQRGLAGNAQLLDLSCAKTHRRLSDALTAARKRLALDPNDGQALRAIGEWYAFRGVWDLAAELLERGRAAGGADVPPLLLERCYRMSGNAEKALAEVQRGLHDASSPDADLRLLRQLQDLYERGTKTRPPGVEALDHMPGLTHPYFALGRIRLASDPTEWEMPLALMDSALKHIRGNQGRAFWSDETAGEVGARLKDPESAKRLYLAMLGARAVGSENYYKLCSKVANCCQALTQFSEAVSWYEKAEPGFDGASDESVERDLGFGDALWCIGRREDAIRVWRRAFDRVGEDAGRNHSFGEKLRSRLQAADQGREPPLFENPAVDNSDTNAEFDPDVPAPAQ